MSFSQVLERITIALNQAEIGYMLSGSIASAYYGTPRSTRDIDIVIAPTEPQLRKFIISLPVSEYYADLDDALQSLRHQSMFNIIDLKTGWKIDMILRKDRPFSQEEFRRKQSVLLESLSVNVASAEDVVISKLEWAKLAQSNRQIDDVAGILRIRWSSIDPNYLQRWIRELELIQEWDRALHLAGLSEPKSSA
jgi:hypothetical protein